MLDVNPTIDAPAIDVAAVEAEPVDATPVATCTELTKCSGGAVTTDRTLSKACSPYTIATDINVNGNATLTIEPGVTLRFASDRVLSIGSSTAAKIAAIGTAAAPIVFTSSNATPGAAIGWACNCG